MKNQRKKILAIGLVALILFFIAGVVYVAIRASTSEPIAPTAPVSEPKAAIIAPGIDDRCMATFTITEITTTPSNTPTATPSATCVLEPPVWSEWSDCTKSCGGGTQTRKCTGGTCGGAATCDAIDGGNSTRACNTQACEASLSIEKKAYQDESTNTAGSYTLDEEISTVSKNQVFVYTITVTNSATVSAEGVVIKDPLTGLNQDKITFKDSEGTCTYTASNKTLTCNTSFNPGQTKTFSFRATVLDTAVNGDVIENEACLTYLGKELCAQKDLNVSTVVSCNHTCTTQSECGNGLTCDSGRCRNSECLSSASCVCPTPTVVTTTTSTPTPQPTILPESGIMDFAGVAAFGGGLLLAVIGILLAL